MWEALGQIAAVLLAITGLAKLFVNDYFKKAKELELVKKKRTDDVLRSLKETVDEHKIELRTLRTSVDAVNTSLRITDKELQSLKSEIENYANISEVRMAKVETQIIKLGENLLMLKGRVNAKNK